MAKLFIFGIGGTGARVIKSLTMLMAAGVRVNASEVVPILVDPDRSNGDLNRTLDILQLYQQIRQKLEFDTNQFFRNSLQTISELATKNQQAGLVAENFRSKLEGVQNKRFRDFIHYDLLDTDEQRPNHDLLSLLFSEANLDASMDVGFKGNPNLGSVVLNQYKDSGDFRVFAENFNPGDRVFIIGSLFGGTGAAGLPLLLKNIRNADSGVANFNFLNAAKVGALAVMPYFGLAQNEQSAIDDQTFMAKTKAALAYYKDNVNGELNALYYIGDPDVKKHDNHEGSTLQKNDAHFVEVASAMAIVDFMSLSDGELVVPVCREFGLSNAVGDTSHDAFQITFGDLETKQSVEMIRRPLMQLYLLDAFVRMKLDDSLGKHPWSNAPGKTKITEVGIGDFRRLLERFLDHFEAWLAELERNRISFSPFNRAVTMRNLLQFVRGNPVKRGFLDSDSSDFVSALNEAAKGPAGNLPEVQKFMAVLWAGTDRLIRQEFKF